METPQTLYESIETGIIEGVTMAKADVAERIEIHVVDFLRRKFAEYGLSAKDRDALRTSIVGTRASSKTLHN